MAAKIHLRLKEIADISEYLKGLQNVGRNHNAESIRKPWVVLPYISYIGMCGAKGYGLSFFGLK